jgi:hypothetical protein
LNEALVSDVFRTLDVRKKGELKTVELLKGLRLAVGGVLGADSPKLSNVAIRPLSQPRPRVATAAVSAAVANGSAGFRTQSAGQVPRKVRLAEAGAAAVVKSGEVGLPDWAVSLSRARLREKSREQRQRPAEEDGDLWRVYSAVGTRVMRQRQLSKWQEFEKMKTLLVADESARKKNVETLFLKEALAEVMSLQKLLLKEDVVTTERQRRHNGAEVAADLETLANLQLHASEPRSDFEEDEDEETRKVRIRQDKKEDRIYHSRIFLKDHSLAPLIQ